MSAERRRRLVEAAVGEFTSSGYELASLNRIIERCQMSKSSFYYVLSSKAELYEFVVGDLLADVKTEFPIVAPEEFAGGDFWERLERYYASLLNVARQHERFQDLGRMFYLPAPTKTAVGGVLDAVRDWVRQVLRVGRGCGGVRTDLPEDLQAELVFRILQVFDEWAVGQADTDASTDLADALFATIRRTLAP
ncbi:DNA-binding transcriptional regulator, AcrR family [Mycolicibacterium rutilum]|uniref:DNA-binding transcriptional regulator, AcrR family n=2 Tax=Mycolicibacterium rutilum TaxID=370526 RepID=A0A1H6K8V9_MYCRU|nr:DNA-binding transcriptional regulator, AcrR family [Mycolicibacterium rutilum]